MQTIDEVKEHCRVVGEGIAAAVAAGEDLGRRFEGVRCSNGRHWFGCVKALAVM